VRGSWIYVEIPSMKANSPSLISWNNAKEVIACRYFGIVFRLTNLEAGDVYCSASRKSALSDL
jgi:hypothetical protein